MPSWLELELPRDAERILAMPEASDVPAAVTIRERVNLVQHLSRLLIPCCLDVAELREAQGEDPTIALGYRIGEALYANAFALLQQNGPRHIDKALGPWKKAVEKAGGNPWPETPAKPATRKQLELSISLGFVALHLLTARAAANEMKAMDPALIANIDQAAILAIITCIGDEAPSAKSDRAFRRLIAVAALRVMSANLDNLATQKPRHFRGPFSELRIREFADLASRSPTMKKRYGERRVETLFEDQLSLLAQSLGFYVVRARTGTRRVDLVCLTRDTADRYTALIEAKTSGKAYSLPTDDQRALREYVEDVRSTLLTLPPLQFVLLVGSKASSTLEAKLMRLESEVSVPVRFLDAARLAELRDLLPGPVPAGSFRELIVRSETKVLPATFVKAVVKAYEDGQQSHVRFRARPAISKALTTLSKLSTEHVSAGTQIAGP